MINPLTICQFGIITLSGVCIWLSYRIYQVNIELIDLQTSFVSYLMKKKYDENLGNNKNKMD